MRLKATTLIESIVAMLLIIISITIATTLYMNMLRTDAINAKNMARALCLAMANETKTLQNWESLTKEQPPFRLNQRAAVFFETENFIVWELQIMAYDAQNTLLYTHRELISISQNVKNQ